MNIWKVIKHNECYRQIMHEKNSKNDFKKKSEWHFISSYLLPRHKPWSITDVYVFDHSMWYMWRDRRSCLIADSTQLEVLFSIYKLIDNLMHPNNWNKLSSSGFMNRKSIRLKDFDLIWLWISRDLSVLQKTEAQTNYLQVAITKGEKNFNSENYKSL